MSVPSLQTGCIWRIALFYPEDVPLLTKLPSTLVEKVLKLREDVQLFLKVHNRIAPIDRQWIIVDDNCEIDWTKTYQQVIKASPSDQAFKFAAANVLKKECASIWQTLSESSKMKLLKCSNAVIRSAAWQAAGYHYLIFYDHVCCIATRNGWPNALKLWLSRVPSEEYDRLCAKLILIAVRYQNYHLLQLLPKFDNFPFTFIFPHGRIPADFIRRLADAPVRWSALTLNIARALIKWASEKDLNEIRIDFYVSDSTAVYGRFIDSLYNELEVTSFYHLG